MSLRTTRRSPAFRATLIAFVFALFVGAVRADEPTDVPEPYRSLPARLQARAAEFPLVPVTTGDEPAKIVTVALNEHPEVFPNAQAFDAIRFRTPDTPGLDLVWAFIAPKAWLHWYILPVEGSMQGFRNWLDADRAYAGFGLDAGDALILQTLPAENLKPGADYLIWFSRKNHVPGEAITLRLALHFAPGKDDPRDWDHEAVEQALQLTAADAHAQADFLKSRGAELLLDSRFFTKDYAAERIRDCLDTRRRTRTAGGFYVTMQTMIPPCGSEPLLSEIVKVHGEPDFVLPGVQRVLFQSEPDDETRGADLHYYDHFALEVNASEKTPRVLRVQSQAFDASSVRPQTDAPTWADVPLPGIDLRIFYVDRREVARVASWGQSTARLISGKLPAGVYTRAYDSGEPMETLTHDGKSAWDYVSFYRSGPAYRRATLRDHAWQGPLTDYHENGRAKAEIPIEKGRRHGVLKLWDENGTLLREQTFEHGEPR